MNMNPTEFGGVITWFMKGFIAALLALLIASFVPSLIPTRAAGVKL